MASAPPYSDTAEEPKTEDYYDNVAFSSEEGDKTQYPDLHEMKETKGDAVSQNSTDDAISSSSGSTISTEMGKKLKTSKNCQSTFSCCEFTFLLLGGLTMTISFSMLVGGYQTMFDSILKSQLEVTPGSHAYELWKVTPVPLFLRVYFFNLTNPRAYKLGAIPQLEEVGPYCYREYHEKQNITFHENSTVSFYQERWWVWDEESAKEYNSTQDDLITTINTIPVSAAWSVRHYDIMLDSLNGMMDELDEELVVTATASEIMFDGIEDPILDWMQENMVPENSTFHPILPFLPPGLTAYDKFGWFYGRNHSLSYDGLFNMYTGEDSLENLGKIDMWNQSTTTKFFTPPCNTVTGSAGEMWPPNLQKTFIEFYSSDLCMNMKLYYKEEAETPNGLTGYRYWGNRYTFSNGSAILGNECYCVKGTCAPYGLMNAESCRMGSPAFISFPHFFNADPYLLKQVKGMAPDEEKHAFIMDLIPEIGTPMHVAARMQINMKVIPYKGTKNPLTGDITGRIDILKNVKETFVPLMWFEEIAGVPDDMAAQLRALTYIMRTSIMNVIFGVMFALGTITIIIVLVRHWMITKRERENTA